jgi:hypothetical protein
MLNFVMVDMPDFVLIQPRGNDGRRGPEDGPVFLNPVFTAIFRAAGARTDRSWEPDPMRFGRAARSKMTPVLRQYGFERLPRTLGELCGLFDYCDRLDVSTGNGLFAPEMLARWQQLTFELSGQRTGLPHQGAVDLYRDRDTERLLAWHAERDVLTKLGSSYRYVPGR